MEENGTTKLSSKDVIEDKEDAAEQPKDDTGGGGGGGWGWGFSPLSVLSDLQKAASAAAEEISRNAAEVAKTAANSIAEFENENVDSESPKDDPEASDEEGKSEDENDKRRKAALEKLENASEDNFIGQGLKAFDDSVENFASGAWQALGNAWEGGSSFVLKLENSIQQGGLAPSLLETGKAFTAKGMEVLEYVGKETADLLMTEKNAKEGEHVAEEDQLLEEVTFDRCFYIYGGPEQLEELEALSNHYALLFNRKKTKLSPEQKSEHDVKLKQIQQIFTVDTESDGTAESEKGKNVENVADDTDDEIKSFHGLSVSKAAEMAAGFANALAGLPPSDIVQKTGGRLDSLHSEGVHRLSEMCCIAVSQLLTLGKAVISNTNKEQDVADENIVKIEWPEDSIEKAKIIRAKTQLMTGYLEAIAISFLTGISDVSEAYATAIKGATTEKSPEVVHGKLIEEKMKLFSENLQVSRTTAVGKIQDGLKYLAYVVLSNSMPTA